MIFKTNNHENINNIIENSENGTNTKFLNSAHSLWIRFKNYDKNPPIVMYDNDQPVSAVFATYSKRTSYINLYEIVTFQGYEGKGYASLIWEYVMGDAYKNQMRRLKISCTPTSISWHIRNGLVFWAVDSSGSLRSDQPLFPTKEEQLSFREEAINNPSIAIPTDKKVLDLLRKESINYHKFGKIKRQRVEDSISKVGKYWLRNYLFDVPSLEKF